MPFIVFQKTIIMAALIIKNFPEALHVRLKEQARLHHRSMAKETIAVLEAALAPSPSRELPPPVKVTRPITEALLSLAKQEGRA